MIDHVGFGVKDIAAAKAFYQQALTPLGMTLQIELTPEMTGGYSGCGFGAPGRPDFWIADDAPHTGLHVAFAVPERAMVDAFHAAALAAGGRDNGPPGIRDRYHPNYYAAFAWDLDGNNIEAVSHGSGDPSDQRDFAG
jgi:catechol 2,3-dioxygenase-like lactoylglutathione lyase family enzyme